MMSIVQDFFKSWNWSALCSWGGLMIGEIIILQCAFVVNTLRCKYGLFEHIIERLVYFKWVWFDHTFSQIGYLSFRIIEDCIKDDQILNWIKNYYPFIFYATFFYFLFVLFLSCKIKKLKTK